MFGLAREPARRRGQLLGLGHVGLHHAVHLSHRGADLLETRGLFAERPRDLAGAKERSESDATPRQRVGAALLTVDDADRGLADESSLTERLHGGYRWKHAMHLLRLLLSGIEALRTGSVPVRVDVPRLELVQPQVDRSMLNRLAAETLGQALSIEQAGRLPALIPSAAKLIPIQTEQQIWDAPLAMMLIVGLIVAEWIVRKWKGLV